MGGQLLSAGSVVTFLFDLLSLQLGPGIIDNVCIPNELVTSIKLFSYPSYSAPVHWEIC